MSTKSVTSGQPSPEAPVSFKLKNPFKADGKADDVPQKPFTEKEADETRAKLIFLYQKGSELLDDILEIIVRDHEPIQIWRLSDEEATMLADLQLLSAKKDPKEARVVRKLVEIYDRLFRVMIIGPRLKATVSHVKLHGGLSFR